MRGTMFPFRVHSHSSLPLLDSQCEQGQAEKLSRVRKKYLTTTYKSYFSVLYSPDPRIEHKCAFLRESRPREIALSLLRARRFPRNLGFTYQLDTVMVLLDDYPPFAEKNPLLRGLLLLS